MPEGNTVSRIYEGSEGKEKAQYIRYNERNSGLILQKELKITLWL